MAITSYSVHKGGKRSSYIKDDKSVIDVAGKSREKRESVNILPDQVIVNDVLTDVSELKIRNEKTKELTRREKRQLERRKNRNRNRTRPFRTDNRLSSKRVDWVSRYIDESVEEDEDNTFGMIYEWIYGHSHKDLELTYNEVLELLRKAS